MSIDELTPPAAARPARRNSSARQPGERSIGRYLGQVGLRLIGWKLTGSLPDEPKYILVGAPHTSNWDFLLTLLTRAVTGANIKFIGKDSLFRGPLGVVMRALGGIPVNRTVRTGFVGQVVEKFNSSSELILAISPEGTRHKSPYWKSGFYYMAHEAGVPVQLLSVDYGVKKIEIGPLFWPSGDLQADMAIIRDFYAGKRGRFPAKQGLIEIEPAR